MVACRHNLDELVEWNSFLGCVSKRNQTHRVSLSTLELHSGSTSCWTASSLSYSRQVFYSPTHFGSVHVSDDLPFVNHKLAASTDPFTLFYWAKKWRGCFSAISCTTYFNPSRTRFLVEKRNRRLIPNSMRVLVFFASVTRFAVSSCIDALHRRAQLKPCSCYIVNCLIQRHRDERQGNLKWQ